MTLALALPQLAMPTETTPLLGNGRDEEEPVVEIPAAVHGIRSAAEAFSGTITFARVLDCVREHLPDTTLSQKYAFSFAFILYLATKDDGSVFYGRLESLGNTAKQLLNDSSSGRNPWSDHGHSEEVDFDEIFWSPVIMDSLNPYRTRGVCCSFILH